MKRWTPAGAALGVALVVAACWHDGPASGPTAPVVESTRPSQAAPPLGNGATPAPTTPTAAARSAAPAGVAPNGR